MVSFLVFIICWPLLYSISYNDHMIYECKCGQRNYIIEIFVNNGVFNTIYKRENDHGYIENITIMNGRLFRFFPDKAILFTYQSKSILGQGFFGQDWFRDRYRVDNIIPISFGSDGGTLKFYSPIVGEHFNTDLVCRGDTCISKTISSYLKSDS
ncbi:hypothetical protein [Vibrio sp. RE88]|uniref:hypothetical protein n=1 Tax=Vibrio sp. RE88 TaxID=2607610 RepID=UPI00149337A3|nr:hypothetical protein [Vibrio sp. RE88]